MVQKEGHISFCDKSAPT